MTTLRTRTPTGEDVTQRPVMKPAFSNALLEQVLQESNLQRAWQQVNTNKGAPGIDGEGTRQSPPATNRQVLARRRDGG